MSIHQSLKRPAGTPSPAPIGVFLPLAVPFAILAGVAVFAALSPFGHANASPASRPGALVWGNGIFANRVELKAWLLQHKGSYHRWAVQHPAALRLVSRHPMTHPSRPVHATAASAPSQRTSHSAPRSTKGAVATEASQRQRVAADAGPPVGEILVFVVLGLLALGAAILPSRFLDRLVPSSRVAASWRVAELRVAVGAAGVAILCGIGFALFIG